jgi:hypothetical protein
MLWYVAFVEGSIIRAHCATSLCSSVDPDTMRHLNLVHEVSNPVIL